MAKDGTVAMLDWMAFNGERMTHCLVGEPTCPNEMGEMMKIGRRGSMTCWFTATGVQGHSAYPHRAKNPMSALVKLLAGWRRNRWTGHAAFRPLDAGDHHHRLRQSGGERDPGPKGGHGEHPLQRHPFRRHADRLAAGHAEAVAETGVEIGLKISISGESFLTPPGELSGLVRAAVQAETGRKPVYSTSAAPRMRASSRTHCPVVEFGLVGKTMHQVDERVEVAQIGS
jgi:succinyl-diaminopimelate desuccinylase